MNLTNLTFRLFLANFLMSIIFPSLNAYKTDLAEKEIYPCDPLSASFFNLMFRNIAFAWNFS